MRKLFMLMMIPLLFAGFTIKAEASLPGHLFILITEHPSDECNVIISAGHIVLNDNGTAIGQGLIRAADNSFCSVTEVKDGSWIFNEATATWNGIVVVTDIFGKSGLAGENNACVPIGEAITLGCDPNVVIIAVTEPSICCSSRCRCAKCCESSYN